MSAKITKPSPYGKFLLKFTETIKTINTTDINNTNILVEIERNGAYLQLEKDFSWNCTNFFHSNSMEISLYFVTPLEVTEDDKLEVTFPDTDFFISTKGHRLKENLLLKINMVE